MEQTKELLRAEHISKSFGVTKACIDISLSINHGVIHGLIGENGSGKSTFTSMLGGVYPQDSGKYFLDGQEFKAKTQTEANYKGVSIIVQEQGTLNRLTVAQNIFLGQEARFMKNGLLDQKKMNMEAENILKQYGFKNIKASSLIDNYDFETRKLIEIAKGTYFEPKILVVDETTTALSEDGRNVLYREMQRVKDRGGSVIFISHDMDEIMSKTDYISILRDGRYIDTVKTSNITEDALKELMVGRHMDGKYYRTDYGEPVSDEVVLSAKDITIPGALKNVNLELHKGEILGIGGLSNCGIHDIGKALFGAAKGREGSVTLSSGKHINSITDAIQNSIAYTSKNRDTESVFLNSSIKDNICLMALDKLKRGPLLSNGKQKDFAEGFTKKMSVKCSDISEYVSSLSGGNKQKVVLARWLATSPDILILDSPTRGIDIKVKADIYALMDQLRKEGKSIIMISEEIMELIGMCDRVVILKDGEISGEFTRSQALSEQNLIKAMV